MTKIVLLAAAAALALIAFSDGLYQTTPDGKHRTNKLTGETCELTADLSWLCASDIAATAAATAATAAKRKNEDCAKWKPEDRAFCMELGE